MATMAASGPLAGLRVFDLTRVLAGPTATQMLGDLGAEVIKIEKPGSGDDTRGFAPPFMPGSRESAYFTGVNRNKRSVTLDIATPKGQELALALIARCDILVENFKVGALAKYGLGYAQLHERFPRLIYCSITGFGQTGPYAPRPGYDSLIQAMGGVMSLTGEPEGLPQKVGVPVADLFAGLYGCIGILAALRHREQTGIGQQIDIGMLDTHVAWLANQGMNYLATGENPPRLGPTSSPTRFSRPRMATSSSRSAMTRPSSAFARPSGSRRCWPIRVSQPTPRGSKTALWLRRLSPRCSPRTRLRGGSTNWKRSRSAAGRSTGFPRCSPTRR
jgi:crotonobetainyl-CoA:carnitine CoA-transferase CaiB-like acyl-CoA transferase